ncbi:MAG: hypothetical protein ABIT01_11380 [Thermoanaerobaculia bacterium]
MQRALLFVLTLIIAAPAGAADEFYTVRLRAGEEAYRAKRYTEAAENLRVACFGLLDQPLYYSEALVGLALAQSATNNLVEADATLARFVEVERLFNAYSQVKLDAAVRSEFEALAARRLNPDSLAALPSLSRLIETREQKLLRMSPADRRKALEELTRTDPRNASWPLTLAREEAAQSDWKGVIPWADAALVADERNVEARALRAHARTMRRDHAEALTDLVELPAARVNADPALTADLFVCRAAGKEWEAARALVPRLDESSRARADVKSALKKLPAEKAEELVVAEVRAAVKPNVVPTPAPTAVSSAAPAGIAKGTPVPKPTPAPATTPTPKMTPPVKATPAPPTTRVPAAPTPSATAGPQATAPPTPNTSSEADVIAAARRLCVEGKAEQAVQMLKGLSTTASPSRDYRKALLEAACLSKDWRSATAQAALMEPFREGEDAFVFYASIAFYETGSIDRARTLLSGARSRIASSPYVDYYSKKILGTP